MSIAEHPERLEDVLIVVVAEVARVIVVVERHDADRLSELCGREKDTCLFPVPDLDEAVVAAPEAVGVARHGDGDAVEVGPISAKRDVDVVCR